MNKKIYLLILFFSFCTTGFTQSAFTPVIVELKAGAKINGTINKNINFDAINKVPLIDLENAKKNIPLKAISKITTTTGETLFPVPVQKPVISAEAQIILKAGAVISGKLYNKNADFSKLEKLNFIDSEGIERKIPLKAIAQIKDAKGTTIYPSFVKKTKPKEPVNTQSSSYDKIFLKAGAITEGTLLLKGQDPTSFDKIPFKGKEGKERAIPLAAIAKIIDGYGNTIYTTKNNITETLEKPAPVVKGCDAEGNRLKSEMLTAFQNKYLEIDQQIMKQTENYKSASFDMEQKLQKEIYTLISANVKELAAVNTMVKAILKIYVDNNGKFVKVEDEVIKYEQLRYYSVLRDSDIYPKLKQIKYEASEISIEYKNEYEKIYNEFKTRIENSSCPSSEFELILSDAKQKLRLKEKTIATTHTVYSIPIEFDFSRKFQKWTYYNDELKVKEKKKFTTINSSSVKKQFNTLFSKRQKNGKYAVNATYYAALGEAPSIKINSVKRKYKYMTHFGVSAFAHLPLKRLGKEIEPFQNALGDIYTFNVNVIFHRIGFFGGTMYNFDKLTKKQKGLYINQNFPTYGEGGLYIGLAQWFYLKGGYSYMKTDIGAYDSGLLINVEKEKVSHGFIAGMALMFPFVNVECGYNSNLGSFYFGGGLHVSLNK